MAINYAKGLSDYEHKGACGLPEIRDDDEIIQNNIEILANWIKDSKRITVLVGADFRGPSGVWTRELKNETVELTSDDIDFSQIKPSFTHRMLSKMIEKDLIQLIISQNVDGLFLKCGLTKRHLSEMHGNFFLDECNTCLRRFIRSQPSKTMGLKLSNQKCYKNNNIEGKPCRGILRDTILDWEDELPVFEMNRAEEYCLKSDLILCLGTSLQIQPVNKMPFLCKKRKVDKGRIVIVNLQKTVMDKKVDLIIHDYVDDVMKKLVNLLDLKIDDYSEEKDLTLTSKPGTLFE